LEKAGRWRRLQKIINILAKHGFGHLIHDLGIDELAKQFHLPRHKKEKDRDKDLKLSKAVRFRMVLEELGPTFIKFGQMLSTRPDIMPPDYIIELRRLQDQVSPFPFEQVKEVIEGELKADTDLLFHSIDEKPLAAASIGQVHSAELPGGKKVVVKVQRPDIKKTIDQDLAILEEIAKLLDKYTVLGKMYYIGEIVAEFRYILNMELNYYHEGRNAERLRKNFMDEEDMVYIPEIYWSYTTQKILTMEYVEGTKLNDLQRLEDEGHSRRMIAETLSRAYLKQVLLDGFFHGDPHPGNIGVLKSGRVFLLDFGVAGKLSEEQREIFSSLLLGFLSGSIDQLMQAVIKMGVITENTDQKQLRWELERLQEKYYDLPLKDIHLGQVLQELIELSFKLHIRILSELTLLAKTFLTLEGTIAVLEPGFSVAELLEPFRKDLIYSKLSKKKITSGIYRNISKYTRLMEVFPEHLTLIMEKCAGGNLKFKTEISDTEKIISKLNNMVNRLSFSIVLASIIVGLCLMLQFAEDVFFRQYHVAEIGLLLAAIMGFWWLWAILRSGRI